MGCQGIDIKHKIVYIDQAGFDLHSSRPNGYAPSGIPAVLSLLPKFKQVTLMGALSEEGFVYHELLNEDINKAKGVGSDNCCLFLSSLASRIPQDLI